MKQNASSSRSMQPPDRPVGSTVLIASAVIFREPNRVLLLRRSSLSRTFPGYWQLPEGRIESGELPEQAIHRELREELSCDIASASYVTMLADAARWGRKRYMLVRSIYAITLAPGRIRLSSEHSEYGFFLPHEVETLDMVPGTSTALKEAAAEARRSSRHSSDDRSLDSF